MPEEDFHLSDHQRFQAHQPSLAGLDSFCSSYPGRTSWTNVLGYFHAVPSGLPRATQSFPSPPKTYLGQILRRMRSFKSMNAGGVNLVFSRPYSLPYGLVQGGRS